MAKKPVIHSKPQQRSAQGVRVQSVTHQTFQGPIPHPAILEQYNNLVPGAAERILVMAEQESRHRQELEKLANSANIQAQQKQLQISDKQTSLVFKSDTVGQYLGFVVSLACVFGCIYLAISGQPWVAGALAGLPLAGIIRALMERPGQTNK